MSEKVKERKDLKKKQERDSFKSAKLKLLEICLVWIICAKFDNEQAKDTGVIDKFASSVKQIIAVFLILCYAQISGL